MTARIDPAERLRRRVREVTGTLRDLGWTVETARLDVDGADPATGIVAAQSHATPGDDEVTFVLTLALGITERLDGRPGPVATLVDETRGNAKVTVELDDGRYWYSRRAGAWEDAAANVVGWCGLELTDELARSIRIARRLRSSIEP